MNNIKKALVCVAAAGASAFATALPVVSDVTMAQRDSGNRMVTITYKLTEDAVVTLDVQTNATPYAATGWTSIGGKAICNAQGAVWRKVTSADADGNDNYTITWHLDQSWMDEFGNGFRIPDGCAKAVVTAWALDNTPNYMVVDISATGGADKQTYYPAADFLPGGVSNGLYKTSTLLMRKIMAKDVKWTMGSVAENGRGDTNEMAHQVTLTNNYYIGVYPVTHAQWKQITGYDSPYFTTEHTMRPVEKVTYTDIRQGVGTASTAASATGGVYPADPYGDSFLGLLRTRTHIDFDLPSEAQWEFAARAGNGDGYWGNGSAILISSNQDATLNRLGRYMFNGGYIGGTVKPEKECGVTNGTAIVGSYLPNNWGLYDMCGNLWEWCLDLYTDDITALNGAVNTTGSNIVKRGGSWNGAASLARPACRASGSPTTRNNNEGFRVACTAGLK